MRKKIRHQHCAWNDNLRPLDRHPFLIAFLITGALLCGAYSSAPFDHAVVVMGGAIDRVFENWQFAIGLFVVALLFVWPVVERLGVSLVGIVRSFRILVVFIAVLVAVLFFWKHGELGNGFWIVGLGIFGFVYLLRHEPKGSEPEKVEDKLHRRYFVERLAQILQEKNTAPKRLAIMGAWGSGKTRILRLLRQELEKSDDITFRIAEVNPWKARSPEEAWAILASGFDQALGHRPFFPQHWADHPFLMWFSSLLPNKDLTALLVRYFAGYDSSGGSQSSVDRLNRRIKAELGDDQSRLLILVDDMERADPSVVRSLLPIIDGLEKFEDCYFVFALDPDRITSAFAEKSENESSTSGYLDKVFDLRIDLPSAREADIRSLAKMKVDPSITPVLEKCLHTLEPLLPSNPRKLERFLAVATAKERMFFHRFSHEEPKAKVFFVCLIIENEFKGFVQALVSPELRESIESMEILGRTADGWNPRNENDYGNLLKRLSNMLSIDQDEIRLSRFDFLFVSLLKLRGGAYVWLTGLSSKMDFDWIERGHTQLELLVPNEMMRAQEKWTQFAGSKSLGEIIHESIDGEDFCDIAQCGYQLIREEVSSIKNFATRYFGGNESSSPNDFLEHVQNLRRQIAWSKAHSDEDIMYFDVDFFYEWLRLMTCFPTAVSWEGRDLRDEMSGLHISLVDNLSIFDVSYGIGWRVLREANENRAASPWLSDHVLKINSLLGAKVAEGYADYFRFWEVADNWGELNEYFQNEYLQLRPEKWLTPYGDGWRNLLRKLEVESFSNRNISNACAFFCQTSFLRQRFHGDLEIIINLGKAYPEYLAFFWRSALMLDPNSADYRNLLGYRNQAAASGHFPAGFLETHFPLPAGDSKDAPSK